MSCNNCWLNRRDVGQVISTDTLSDDVLLAMFDFCADEYQDTKEEIEEWQSLVYRVSVGDGELSFLDHHVISISGSFVQKTHL